MSGEKLPPLLHAHFVERCQETPEQVALIEGDRSVTFRELSEDVARLASGLRAEGMGVGSAVGVHMDRSIEWVTTTLAVLSVNAAVVPLPPSYPDERLREILEFAQLDAVVESEATPMAPELPGRRLIHAELAATAPSHLAPTVESPDQLAFVLCSSGSTGRPKMIARSHRSFFHRLCWTWRHHPYEEGERCCQKSHMTTTHAVYELFEPLLKGVPVVIIGDEEVRDLERFWETLRTHHISRLLLVPAQLQASLGMPRFEAPPLKVLVLMGEYVSPTLVERAHEGLPPTTSLFSIYGSTEASSTLVCDLREDYQPGRELPLGRPIAPDITCQVINGDGTPVAMGKAGRLHIGGPPLFSGYFRDPTLTASVLNHGSDPVKRLYDTGDEVRLTEDGALEFVGRADQTVKVRGFRVDTREVEGTLLRHPSVRQAAIVVTESQGGDTALHAFVSPASVAVDDLYAVLRDRLPEYMVPSRVTPLDEFPLTPSGKIDRLRLEKHPSRKEPSVGERKPASETEKQVAAVWETLLGEHSIPRDANFFETGGTSLSAFSLVHQLRERMDLDRNQLDVETVYRSPTVKDLAARIDEVLMPGMHGGNDTPVDALVTLRPGRAAASPPVFLIAPAGGALGSYGKLTRLLTTPRELVGVRDPFLWGDRDPTGGFHDWVERYLREIRARQGTGPYTLVAYSSAAPFAYELARRLRASGEAVPLLALIDPLGLDRGGKSRYGAWVMKATMGGAPLRTFVRILGRMRLRPISQIPVLWNRLGRSGDADWNTRVEELMEQAARSRFHIMSLSALLELNTGLPYALEAGELERESPDRYLDRFRERVEALSPEVDFEAVKQVVLQYPLQVQVQENYRLQPYDGRVLLVEASAQYTGLVRAQLRPYLKDLRYRVLEVGPPSDRVTEISKLWGPTATHFRSIRDDRFVRALAAELDRHLD